MSEQIRVVYHPAPFDPDGGEAAPPVVELGSDLESAFRWVRRRLNLPATGELRPATEFTPEPLPEAPARKR